MGIALPSRSVVEGEKCLFHLEVFRSLPSPLHHSDFCIFWLGFESSGLGVLCDEILEVALTEDSRPMHVPDGPGVHGIEQDELLTSPHFHEVFPRMLTFVNAIVENSLEQADSSDEDSAENVAGCRS